MVRITKERLVQDLRDLGFTIAQAERELGFGRNTFDASLRSGTTKNQFFLIGILHTLKQLKPDTLVKQVCSNEDDELVLYKTTDTVKVYEVNNGIDLHHVRVEMLAENRVMRFYNVVSVVYFTENN